MVHRRGQTHFERFLAALAKGDEDQAERLASLLTEEDAPQLRVLAEGSEDERWWAARCLASVGDAFDVPLFLSCIQEPDPGLRAVGLLALATLYEREPDAVAIHLEQMAALLADLDGLVRQTAVDALARCGDEAVPVLTEALESPYDGVRVRAAKALHRIGTMAVAPPLYDHLEDSNPVVRHYAYETLEQLGLLNNIFFKRE